MKLTVIGGTGLIGSQVVQKLTAAGHEAVPAALSTGVDLITGKGLDQALEGAEVVINLADSPTFDEASLDFFRTSMTNLLAAGERAGARHQVILSIVGVDQVPQLDYFPLDELGRVTLAARQDNRTVITDDKAGMFAAVTGDVLIAGPDAHLAPTHYQDWIQTVR
jgi:uncharacterized protein YbjT (DUF2867 family)